ncbi:serine hydrolase [Paenibacillus qinlingensis]|uniref:CubicO group peptidase (Beta-lactamase class C family) n=1 Tax=Paenibacillus qinlingensis TaxID=1837343 RepID=A0ABU1NQ99_9BACL|nr:serine hydrolase [Paenibacillus qinlingensis]MDR6549598.1 CubicO group peptidase (beta-lactamase class C family) [Paenibacillus qinlingensis]
MNFQKITETLEPVNLVSCLISQQGQLLFEQYREPQLADALDKINSCTKSILSALCCIALDQGLLPDPSTPVSFFFPQLANDPQSQKADITLLHLLTMTSGINWTEFGGQNSFPSMTRTPHWVNFVLDQPLADVPGTRMTYNSGGSQLLAAILREVTGMSVARYAENHLFGPLGIESYTWEQDPQGIHTGGFGMSMRPLDMLKFGQLYAQQGRWGNQQIISQALIHRSTQPAIHAESPRRGSYGWHWWTDTYPDQTGTGLNTPSFDYFNAYGFGGQAIYIVPSLEAVIVLTNDQRVKKKIPLHVFRTAIAPYLLT